MEEVFKISKKGLHHDLLVIVEKKCIHFESSGVQIPKRKSAQLEEKTKKHSNFHNFLITYGAFVLITTISDLFYLLNRKPTLMLKLRALDLIKSSSYYITYHCTEPDRYR
uniref:Uncharacterized protein n=1 Tax=Cacopsylla melanoneura TaxID=428564 RepID=A0A8D8SIG3_9HEMI